MKTTNKKGFTLVEVIISVAVLCLVCGIILRLFVSADDLRQRNLDTEKAQVMALNKMEELKLADEPLLKDILSEPDYDGVFTLVEYYDSNWNGVQSWENPLYILEINIKPSEEGIFTESSFGKTDDRPDVLSKLFDISVSVMDIEKGKDLTEIESAKYYSNLGVGK